MNSQIANRGHTALFSQKPNKTVVFGVSCVKVLLQVVRISRALEAVKCVAHHPKDQKPDYSLAFPSPVAVE